MTSFLYDVIFWITMIVKPDCGRDAIFMIRSIVRSRSGGGGGGWGVSWIGECFLARVGCCPGTARSFYFLCGGPMIFLILVLLILLYDDNQHCSVDISPTWVLNTEITLFLADATARGSVIHYNDVIMRAMATQITGVSIVCSSVGSAADQRKHQSSASLAFVCGEFTRDRWILRTKGQ